MLDIEAFVRNKAVPHKYGHGKKGQEIKVHCPVCDGKYKLWCSLSDEVYFCHRCRWSTDNPELLVKLISKCNPFVAALICNKYQKQKPYKSLEDYVNEHLDKSSFEFSEDEEDDRNHVFSVLTEPQEKPPLQLPSHFYPLGDPRIPTITKYAFSRGFSFKILVAHRFGGCPMGSYRGSLIIPAYHGDRLMFWQARDALGRDYNTYPKYRTPVGYSSNGCLFNLDEATKHPTVILCEGVFSALRTGTDAVATFGNKISDDQCLLLKEREVTKVILCFDPDTWSLPKAMLDRGVVGMKPPIYHALMKLLDYFDSVKVVRLREGDPDEIGTKKVRELINNAVSITDYADIIKVMI